MVQCNAATIILGSIKGTSLEKNIKSLVWSLFQTGDDLESLFITLLGLLHFTSKNI